MSTLSKNLLATTAGIVMAAGVSSYAIASPPPFTIDPVSAGYLAGVPFPATDFNGTSDALIHQTGPSTQVETGWVQGTGFTNNGTNVPNLVSGMVTEGNIGAGTGGTYNLYINFSATVTGISGFGPGQSGSIAPGAFNFSLLEDLGDNDTFTPADPNVPTNATVTDVGSNDVVFAVGSSITGSAGFQNSTGAPTFNTVSTFVVCDGTTNQGVLGGVTVAAAGCGTFDARTYFVAPSPFYSIQLASNTSGSASDLNLPTTPNGYASLNGIVVDVNFAVVPEPASLLLFGSGLLGLGLAARRRRKTAA